MATKRTKIGALIALDGEASFKASISRCKASVAAMKSELDGLNSKYKGNANSMEALTAVQQKYAEIQSTAAKQVEKMSSAYEASAKKQEQIRGTLEDIGQAYDKAQAALDEMTKSGEASEEQISAQEKVVENAKSDYNDLAEALEKAQTRTEQYRKALADARKTEQEAAQGAAEYAGYLAEAQTSPTGTATSIDSSGKKVNLDASGISGIADDLEDVAEEAAGAGTAMDTFKGVLGGNFVTTGLEKVSDLLLKAGKYALDVGSSFEAAMSKVEALSGATGADYEKLSTKAKELGADTVFSATDAADAFGYMSLAGWSTEQMLESIDGVLDLAAASSMDLADASSIVTDYIAAFGLSASDAAHFADLMTTAMSTSNTDTVELAEAYKNCASTAGSFGYSVEEVTAVLATMANQGVKGSEAGTALNSIMTRLATNSSNCADELSAYGVAIYNTDGSMKSLSEILQSVSDAFSGLSDEQQAALAKSIAGTEQYSKFQAILAGLGEDAEASGKSFADYAEALQACDGAAEQMADTMSDNLKGDLDDLSSAAEGIGVTMYEAFGDKVRGVVQDLSGALGDLSDAIKVQDQDMSGYMGTVSDTMSEASEATAAALADAQSGQEELQKMQEYIAILNESWDMKDVSGYAKYQLQEALKYLQQYAPQLSDYIESLDLSSIGKKTREEIMGALTESTQQAKLSSFATISSEYSAAVEKEKTAIEVAIQARDDIQKEIENAEAEWKKRLKTAMSDPNDENALSWDDGSYTNIEQLKDKLNELNEQIIEHNGTLEDAEREQKAYLETQQDFLDEMGISIDENGNYVDTLEDVASATEDAADATDDAADAAEKATISIEGLEDEQNAALQAFLDASQSVDQSGFSKSIEKQMTEAAGKVEEFRDTLQNAFTIDPLSNFAGDALDATYGTAFEDRVAAIESSVLDARWAVKYFYEDIEKLKEVGAPEEVVNSLLSRGVEDAYSDAETLAQLAETDKSKFSEIMGYWQDVQGWQDEAENALLTSYADTIMEGIDGGYQAWYQYGISTTQGLFDAIEQVQAALEDGGVLESLGDFNTAFQSVLQARAQVGYTPRNTETSTTAALTSQNQNININLTAELDGQKMYDTLIRYDGKAKKQKGVS